MSDGCLRWQRRGTSNRRKTTRSFLLRRFFRGYGGSKRGDSTKKYHYLVWMWLIHCCFYYLSRHFLNYSYCLSRGYLNCFYYWHRSHLNYSYCLTRRNLNFSYCLSHDYLNCYYFLLHYKKAWRLEKWSAPIRSRFFERRTALVVGGSAYCGIASNRLHSTCRILLEFKLVGFFIVVDSN